MNQEEAKKKIADIEAAMGEPTFWADKDKAQAMIRELKELQSVAEGGGRHDRGGATVSILAGAGGDDAEDFARMLLSMYQGYAARKGWGAKLLDENENDHGGFRNVTFEVSGKGAFGRLSTRRASTGSSASHPSTRMRSGRRHLFSWKSFQSSRMRKSCFAPMT
ncbi:MAG: PCRF domain-containing protein [Patescibacteria group bacterium]